MKFLKYFFLSIIVFSVFCAVAGIRINTSKSIPVGIYRTCKAPVEKGAFVLFCPPPGLVFDMAKERGYIAGGFCPGGYGYMMKGIAATEGDIVTVHDDGVRVDGILLPHSMPLKVDPAGRSLPYLPADTYTLDNSELFLMSDACSISFDGRYFGPINRSQIKTVIQPVFAW